MAYYIDACIYLDIWCGGVFEKESQAFFDRAALEQVRLAYSGIVLKELQSVLKQKVFAEKRRAFDDRQFARIKELPEDYDKARHFQVESGFDISFADCMHLVLAMRCNYTLVTRDKKLSEFARSRWRVVTPEAVL